MTTAEDASEEDLGEQVEDLDALEDKVAVAAEAAATAAAHAVAAAKAAEEISRAREEAEAGAAQVETSATDPEPSREATDPNAELPEDSATKPDVVAPDSDAETEPSVSSSSDSATSDQTFDDLLNLDAPDGAMPTVLARIALMALGAAAAIFLVSIVLVSTLPKGTFFDVVILVAWLAVGALSIGGFALLAAAGIAKATRSADRA